MKVTSTAEVHNVCRDRIKSRSYGFCATKKAHFAEFQHLRIMFNFAKLVAQSRGIDAKVEQNRKCAQITSKCFATSQYKLAKTFSNLVSIFVLNRAKFLLKNLPFDPISNDRSSITVKANC